MHAAPCNANAMRCYKYRGDLSSLDQLGHFQNLNVYKCTDRRYQPLQSVVAPFFTTQARLYGSFGDIIVGKSMMGRGMCRYFSRPNLQIECCHQAASLSQKVSRFSSCFHCALPSCALSLVFSVL